MQSKYIQIGKQRIAYYESEGKGAAVVLVHGSNLSALSFRPQFEGRLAAKFRLIGLDLPGHGLSGPAVDPEETYTSAGLINTLTSFAEELSLGRAVYVGCSLGGHAVVEASDRLNASGLMIFGAPPLDSPLSVDGKFRVPVSMIASIYKQHLSDEEIEGFVTACLKPGSKLDRRPLIEDIRRTDGAFREVFGQSVFQGNYRDEISIVKDLSVPLAILHGKEEQFVEGSYYDSLSIPSLWRGGVQVVPGAGHLLNLEQPDMFNDLLEEFIADIS